MLCSAVLDCTGPAAVRYPRGSDGTYTDAVWEDRIHQEADLTILTYGTTINDVLEGTELLKQDQITADVIKLDRVQPLELPHIHTEKLLVVEETAEHAGIGAAVLSAYSNTKGRVLHLCSGLIPHGDSASLRRLTGLDPQGIYQAAKELLADET